MTMLRGADFRVDIDGTFFAVQRIEVGGRVQALNVSNTEGRPGNANWIDTRAYTSKLPDLPEGTIRLVMATFDDAENPFSSPIDFRLGDYYSIIAYPNGDVFTFAYDYGNCLSTSFDHSGSLPGNQPFTMSFETDGFFAILIV